MARRAGSTAKPRSAGRVKHKRAQSPRVPAAHLAAGAVLLLALLSLLEPYVWLGAVIRELAVYVALGALVVAGALFATRQRVAGASAALACVLLLAPMWPLFRRVKPTPAAGPTLRVLHAHVNGQRVRLTDVAAWLGARAPHIAALTGVGSDAAALPKHLNGYRIEALEEASTGAFSAVFVRDMLAAVKAPDTKGVLTTGFRLGRCDVRAVVVDLPALVSFQSLSKRRARIDTLARTQRTARSIWLGHLASRAEASDLRSVLEVRELRDSRRGFGRLASAPAALGAFGLPVDHILVHGWIGVRERSAESPIVDGAHRTTAALLELTEPRCRALR